MKRIPVRADDLLRLIDSHDSWAGSLPLEEQDEHRAEFAALREKAEEAVKESNDEA